MGAKPPSGAGLGLDPGTRRLLWERVAAVLENFEAQVASLRVAPDVAPQAVREPIARFDFSEKVPPLEALAFAANGLTAHQTHTPHPRYWGLFNPAPTAMGVAADALVAGFNPQVGAWGHSPFAVEVERHLVAAFAGRFGWNAATADGTFTSGGSEANHTALVAALVNAFPSVTQGGLRSLPGAPVLYVSAEAHHSFHKAAQVSGLGTAALRAVRVDESLRMRPDLLAEAIRRDRRDGFLPFLVVGTAGTTNAGAFDPLDEIASIAAAEALWLHADAAWGGAAALVPELRENLRGIERADSITFDAHKFLSVPMGAGLILTRRPDVLGRAFHVAAPYVPPKVSDEVPDYYQRSFQWSRRFIGLKVFLSLAVAGWEGYAVAIRHQTAVGRLLREKLAASGWRLANDSPLPIVCFDDGGADEERLIAIAARVVGSGEAWISTTRIGPTHRLVLRACVTNYKSSPEDVTALVASLEKAR